MSTRVWTGATNSVLTTAGNWSGSTAPVAGDDVIFQPGVTNYPTSALQGLNTAALSGALATVKFLEGWPNPIGSYSSYLQFTCTRLDFWSSGPVYLDLEGSTIAPQVFYTAPANRGDAGLYLKGSALTTLNVQGGIVGLAMLGGETATITEGRCGGSNAKLYLGAGVTATTVSALVGGTIYQRCASTTSKAVGGTLYTEEAGAITTVTVYKDGKAYLNSSGTITTLNIEHVSSLVDFLQSSEARTVTTLNWKHGRLRLDKNVLTVTTFSAPGVAAEVLDGTLL